MLNWNELCSFNYQLLIGTQCGLFTNSIFGNDLLMDDVSVTAMVADNAGVWVGTGGQGLYRWDGVDFQKRYLSRDPSLFDHINTLDFKHDHLYAGTRNGLHIYDGGSWETLTVEDGLPGNNVIDIDASNWVVYIATDNGIVSCFNYDFMPVAKLENTAAEAVLAKDRKVYVGTCEQGIQMKSGPVLKTLVEPDDAQTVEVVASALH
jgi:ligand-binding sensor domain-containing protein